MPVDFLMSATEVQILNLAPLLELAEGGIGTICIMMGKGAPPVADVDRTHVEDPLLNFARALEFIAGRRGLTIGGVTQIHGDGLDIAHWQEEVSKWVKERPEPNQICFSYKGGSKEMCLGATLALDGYGADFVAFQPRPARLVRPLAQTPQREQRIPAERQLDLETYLRLHGYTEWRPEDRIAREKAATKRQRLTAALAGLVFAPVPDMAHPLFEKAVQSGRARCLALMNDPNRNLPRHHVQTDERAATTAEYIAGRLVVETERAAFRAALIKPLSDFLRSVRKLILEDGNDVTRYATGTDDGFSIGHADLTRFLRSDWFEEFVYAAVRAAMPGAFVGLGVKYAPHKPEITEPAAVENDLDVAIFAENQLHAIECKLSLDTKGLQGKQDSAQAVFAKAGSIHRKILKTYGMMTVLTARLLDGEGDDHAEKARRNGVNLVQGGAGLDRLVAGLKGTVHFP